MPSLFHHLDSSGRRNFEAVIACMIIGGLAVALRIYCKLAYKNGIHADDWFMFLSVAAAWAAGATDCWGIFTGGYGRDMNQLLRESSTTKNQDSIERLLLALYLSMTFYVLSAYAVKISVLLFYRRIFVSTIYQRISLVIIVVATLWFIIGESLSLAGCIHLDAFWHQPKAGKCLNKSTHTLGVGIIDTLLDLVIICLPLRMVFTLQMPMRTKVGLAAIFAVCGMVVVTNVLRVRIMYQPNSFFINYDNALFWSSIHLMTAYLCGCLPVYEPLWQAIAVVVIAITSRFASKINTTIHTYIPHTKKPQPKNSSTNTSDAESDSANLAKFRFNDADTIESSSSGPTLVPPAPKGLLNVRIESGLFTTDNEGWQVPEGTILYSRDYHMV